MKDHLNIGWTIGEEVLFKKDGGVRKDSCIAEDDSCVIGIDK
jgi:hypothetical protein